MSGGPLSPAVEAVTKHHRWYGGASDTVRIAGGVLYAALAFATVSGRQYLYAVPLVLVTLAGGSYARLLRDRGPRHVLIGLTTAVAAGDVFYALAPRSVGWAVSLVVLPWALGRLPVRWTEVFGLTVVTAVSAIGFLRDSTAVAFGLMAGCLGVTLIGFSVRTARRQAADIARLLVSERAARTAAARSEMLAERQRLAREVHDILGHTLSAQVMCLENALLLLDRDAPKEAVTKQVEQAQRLARAGVMETRRAVYSLRGTARPAPETIERLATEANAEFTCFGEDRAVSPEVALTLERAVQEALTNARKYAPGADVTVHLQFDEEGYGVDVTDTGAREPHVPTDTGTGYGLAGMRERAELLNGRFDAAPFGEGFRVRLWIPA
ncbi:histidine kinase [Actinoplanes sp. NPDC048791]|uniref:sensor histidine kinase n=1 Tax=Actinoplanes sp. NPDC048791 TaxID=3154623 RepID=UPI0033EF01D3